MMQYNILSSFQSLPIEIFWYPSKNVSSRVILLLKGLYGLHVPNSKTSWETTLIAEINDNAHVVCVNTARMGEEDEMRSSSGAFLGKSFAQECNDIQQVYGYLKKNDILPKSYALTVVGNSFGGTLVLGMPELLKDASSVVMIGSGCGKSATTTKPLLTTLPDEEILLQTLRSYVGMFAYVYGERDVVVPRESQIKVMESATNACVNMRYVIAHALHDLTSPVGEIDRTRFLASILDHLSNIEKCKK